MARKQKQQEGVLNEEQLGVFTFFKKKQNLYLCGKGGTGKSFLTRYIIDWCKNTNRTALVCAPTGIAAHNIGGSTIHRTFSAPKRVINPGERCYKSEKLELIAKADVIIIDEISMCRLDLFEYMANTLLYVKPQKQILVVGDFYQLPPVLSTSEQEAYSKLYGTKLYPFESELWYKLGLQTVELKTSMRQSDKAFVSALDKIRVGIPDFSVFPTYKPVDPTALTICGRNEEADAINKKHLDRLKKDGAKEVKLKSIITGIVGTTDKPTDDEIPLCAGAKVVMLNNDSDGRWINGSFAEVARVSSDSLSVRIEGKQGIHEVKRFKWTCIDYEIRTTSEGAKITPVEVGSFEQFPVRLAWAITIHKSQGQTYNRVNVNVSSIFAAGQLYVALSRCKSLDGMQIIGTLTESKVIVSEMVKKFMQGKGRLQDVTGILPLYDDDVPTDERYQEGYDEGYKDGTEDTEAKYRQRIIEDPGVKVLSEYTRRQKELAQIEDPEERNPKGAGRKKLAINEKKESKAIRVPGELADLLKEIGDLAKENPDRIEQLKSQCTAIIETYR